MFLLSSNFFCIMIITVKCGESTRAKDLNNFVKYIGTDTSLRNVIGVNIKINTSITDKIY